jgi:protein disulfide-isomerase A1
MWILAVVLFPLLINAHTDLTELTIDGFIGKNEISIILFHAPWCEHCDTLKPEFVKAGENLSKHLGVAFAMADCDKHPSIQDEYEIEGFPTISLFHKEKKSDYLSGRNAESIVNWVNRKLASKVELINSHEVMSQFMEGTENRVLAVYTKDMDEELEIVHKLADNDVLFESAEYIFGIAIDKSLVSVPKIEHVPALIMYKSFEDKNPVVFYEGSLTNPLEILGWI